MKKNNNFKVILLTLLFILGSLQTAYADNNNSKIQIYPPNSKPYGNTYGEWSEHFWQWLLSIPASVNPGVETTGENCMVGQQGPVWLLGWSFGTSVEKSCTIPAGKAIFTPVYNWLFGGSVGDCEPTNPGVKCDVAALLDNAVANTEKAEVLEVWIDGVKIRDIRKYHAASPKPFEIALPPNNVAGASEGIYYPHVSYGYWLMLSPLPVGKHDIKVKVFAPGVINLGQVFDVDFESIFHLNIVPLEKNK